MSKDIRFCGIDPSSKTGFVILDSNGDVVISEEVKAGTTDDPARMIEIAKTVIYHLNPKTDKVVIEGFAYASKGRSSDFQYGLGWLIRAFLHMEKIKYVEATPSQLKKFACNKGNAKKDDLVLPIYKKWGFESWSDNIRDAYVLARMAYSMYNPKDLKQYEIEVLKKMKKA